MKNIFKLVVVTLLVGSMAACSTSKALIKMDGMDPAVRIHNGAVSGQNLGMVKGDEGGAIWANCTEKAVESARFMIEEAKAKGANAIGDIKWHATEDATPSCKKGWGYLVIWPFILTPLFMSTAVEGTAYKVADSSPAAPGKKAPAKKKSTGLYMIPEGVVELDALARSIVAGI